MDHREDYSAKEQAAWQAFLAVLDSVPHSRRDDPSVVPGWSVKDLICHNAGWAAFAADELDKMAGRAFADPFDERDGAHWDRVQEAIIEEGRLKTFEETLSDAERTREHVREIWSSLPTIDEPAAKFFAEETFIHYEEHTTEIQQFLERAKPG